LHAIHKSVREKIWERPLEKGAVRKEMASSRGRTRDSPTLTLYTTSHHKNMAIVSNPRSLNPDVVVFPKAEHRESFLRAHKSVRSYGPSDKNPGSVGTLSLSQDSPRANFLNIEFAHAHFTTEKDKAKQGKTNKLPKKLSKKYGGWRKEALKEGIRIAMSRRKILRLDLSNFNMKHGNREAFLRDLGVAIVELGMSGQGSIKTKDGLWLKFGDRRGEFVRVHEGCFAEIKKTPGQKDEHSLEHFLDNLHTNFD